MGERIAAEIMDAARLRDEVRFKLAMSKAIESRRAHKGLNWRSRTCPGCGSGLKVYTPEGGVQTLLLCPNCSANHVVDFQMDEGVEMGKEYIPGVTKQRRPTVRMGLDGKIKSIEGI